MEAHMELQEFLTGSSLAEKITVPLSICLGRVHISPQSVGSIPAETLIDTVHPLGSGPDKEKDAAVLESGGVPLALGRVVKKGGRYYFKITQEVLP
jgi:hypothetical protein